MQNVQLGEELITVCMAGDVSTVTSFLHAGVDPNIREKVSYTIECIDSVMESIQSMVIQIDPTECIIAFSKVMLCNNLLIVRLSVRTFYSVCIFVRFVMF